MWLPCVEAFIQEHPDFSNNGPEESWDLPDITEFLGIGRMMLWQHQRITVMRRNMEYLIQQQKKRRQRL